MADPVRLAVEDGVARITIARPAVRNALNRATCRALVEALTQAGEHPSVRVILLRGEGEEAFCAGADLGELAELQARGDVLAIRELFSGVAECILALEESPVPVVGMVIGHALGGGLGLAAACDILYVADDARLGLPELGVGLFPMVVMAPILRSVGRKRALELIFSAGTIDGAEAARIGLATRAFPRAELQPATEQLLERVAAFRQRSCGSAGRRSPGPTASGSVRRFPGCWKPEAWWPRATRRGMGWPPSSSGGRPAPAPGR